MVTTAPEERTGYTGVFPGESRIVVDTEQLDQIAEDHFRERCPDRNLRVEMLSPRMVDDVAAAMASVRESLGLTQKHFLRPRTAPEIEHNLALTDSAALIIVDENRVAGGGVINFPDLNMAAFLAREALCRWMFSPCETRDVAYMEWSFVSEADRGMGLQSLLIRLREAIARANGKKFAFSRVAANNTASLKNFERAGYERTIAPPLGLVVQVMRKDLQKNDFARSA